MLSCVPSHPAALVKKETAALQQQLGIDKSFSQLVALSSVSYRETDQNPRTSRLFSKFVVNLSGNQNKWSTQLKYYWEQWFNNDRIKYDLSVITVRYINQFKSHHQLSCIPEHELTQEEWESVCLNTGLLSVRLPGLQLAQAFTGGARPSRGSQARSGWWVGRKDVRKEDRLTLTGWRILTSRWRRGQGAWKDLERDTEAGKSDKEAKLRIKRNKERDILSDCLPEQGYKVMRRNERRFWI